MSKEDEKERIELVAARIEPLLAFAALFIEDIDLLERVVSESYDISNKTLTLAPVLGAVGLDYEEKHIEAEVRRKRAVALLNFVKTIKDTEDDRTKFKATQTQKAEARMQLSHLMGGAL